MQYKKFGNTGISLSRLGFGAMRFPTKDNDPTMFNEDEAIAMLRYAINQGINYIDTAYPYHGGQSEVIVGKALKDGYREKTKIASKLPIWLVEKVEDCETYLDEQLKNLDVDYIDLYGKIGYIGFSFHDDLELFKEIIDAFDWDFCQIQFNYMDEYYQAGLEGLNYAAAKEIPVVVMEPLQGGNLTKEPPRDIQELWEETNNPYTPAQWALRWVCNHPQVSVILSGMSTMEQIKENIETVNSTPSNTMPPKEVNFIEQVRDKYLQKIKVRCTECKYCIPCPSGVNIPQNFQSYNRSSIYGPVEEYQAAYKNLEKNNASASFCIECGQCQEVCPQNI